MKRKDSPFPAPRSQIVEFIGSMVKIGQGTAADPVRLCAQLWTRDGILVAEYDPSTDRGWYCPSDFQHE